MSNWTNLPKRMAEIEKRVGNQESIDKVIKTLEDKIQFLYDKVAALESMLKPSVEDKADKKADNKVENKEV